MAIAAVRPAAARDVDEIVRIQSATWELAYAALVPGAAIARIRSSAARQAWGDALEAGAGHHVLVATEGGATVGFCACAPASEGWAEIGVLLVEPRWGRRGHGGRLLAAVASGMRDAGAQFGLAWVPEADEASRRFYARAGWAPDGSVRVLDTGDGELREIRITGHLDLALTD